MILGLMSVEGGLDALSPKTVEPSGSGASYSGCTSLVCSTEGELILRESFSDVGNDGGGCGGCGGCGSSLSVAGDVESACGDSGSGYRRRMKLVDGDDIIWMRNGRRMSSKRP